MRLEFNILSDITHKEAADLERMSDVDCINSSEAIKAMHEYKKQSFKLMTEELIERLYKRKDEAFNSGHTVIENVNKPIGFGLLGCDYVKMDVLIEELKKINDESI